MHDAVSLHLCSPPGVLFQAWIRGATGLPHLTLGLPLFRHWSHSAVPGWSLACPQH